jgi:myo-inositol-1(or 4)-monophosphatase
MEYYGRPHAMGVSSKGTQNLVTRVDRECEELIAGAVFKDFPGDCILGEEGGLQNEGGRIVWVIDPIDGTTNFIRRIPQWCVSIGIVANAQPMIGVIYDPVHNELFHARKGSGAFCNDTTIAVSAVDKINEAHIGLGFSFRRPVHRYTAAIGTCLGAHCEFNRLGSGALSLAYVADGRMDGYWEAHMNAWDAAAGIALVEEAGGWVNDFFSGNGLHTGNVILASARGIADQLRKLLPADDLKEP